MLKFFTSLGFLYLLVIATLLAYGYIYYRDFRKSRLKKWRFPIVFLIIGCACMGFLWINAWAPLQLQTFSNLDHHFIRHDGYAFARSIELGGSDTVNSKENTFNNFTFAATGDKLYVHSKYSEDPFYLQHGNTYQVASVNFPAMGKPLSLHAGAYNVSIVANGEDDFEMKIGDDIFKTNLKIKKGINAWSLFSSNDELINSLYYNDDNIVNALKNISFLRDSVSSKSYGQLRIFISGRIFRFARQLGYNGALLHPKDLHFSCALPEESRVAWGTGFLTNNRNQFSVSYAGRDSFILWNRYPVSYPLTQEDRGNWDKQQVTKFLVSDGKDLLGIPAALGEGFLFSFPGNDKGNGFSPVLLNYEKNSSNEPLKLNARSLRSRREITTNQEVISLPATNDQFNWLFSVKNTFNWNFGSFSLKPATWMAVIFGSLGLFVMLVVLASLFDPLKKGSWVWQLLSSVTLVLLTTRYFLYWRYKSFPPYEGMDLPSLQQLESFANFGVIVFATVALATVFGFGFLKFAFGKIQGLARYRTASNAQAGLSAVIRSHTGLLKTKLANAVTTSRAFFICWSVLLITGGLAAALNNFDAGVCRRLALVLTVAWFIFVFISYKHSPLAQPTNKAWWRINTMNRLGLAISNPVKVILSVSLLALFAFIDIGFAIVFLNFLFFNEAFLCINYGIAGLSAGSKRNARFFSVLGAAYLGLFVINLFFAPYLFKFLLNVPTFLFICGYGIFALVLGYLAVRVLPTFHKTKQLITGLSVAAVLFVIAFLFFPRERILEKAAMTKYRIDVLTTPVDECITTAYEEGSSYKPVIRAAQNQWFINTFIDEENNPAISRSGFTLLPHAPQNKGARYNAQATDLVTSRFLVAEHGKWSVLLYVLLLMLPGFMLASFYKLYPDFTNRTNTYYATVTTAFSMLNYLLITALLVILAATGRYIFFGQDLPFASILSKQSILFPAMLIIGIVLLFRSIPQEHYSNRRKAVPGSIVFAFLLLLLLFFKPSFNKSRVFNVENLANEMDEFVHASLQPVMDYIDTSAATARFTLARKDRLFADTLRKMIASNVFDQVNKFYLSEINAYARTGLSRHFDQRHILYLDMATGSPQLAVNDNYFRVEPPPHLQQLWTGNVFGDTSVLNVSLWNKREGSAVSEKIYAFHSAKIYALSAHLALSVSPGDGMGNAGRISLLNTSAETLKIRCNSIVTSLEAGKELPVTNPCKLIIYHATDGREEVLTIEPDAFMKNYYVNGSRYYIYPLENRFIWARNFAESIATEYAAMPDITRNASVSLNFELMDSLSVKVERMMANDTSYHTGAEYGITIADGNGRIIAMADHIKKFQRPDPNDKAAFNHAIHGENGFVPQALLRKQIGNLNLLRLNPGPGSTFKPVVFSAIASQLDWNWDGFAAEGFAEKQMYFGGERVPEYDFEKNNGRITRVSDYLKYSDNYYHANVLLLGSYPKQDPGQLLSAHFSQQKPGAGVHWPYFTYTGRQYFLNGFENWPGYERGMADFGSDSSFTTIGLLNNYNIFTHPVGNKAFDMHFSAYDSLLFGEAYRRSGFILPEYSLFDQRGEHVDHRIPYDLFTTCFRGHVKGSSQVMVSPVKMAEAYGRMVSQNRNYHLTFDPYATVSSFVAFDIDEHIPYNRYLSIMRENVFTGMREALFTGTAVRLGRMLKNGSPYYYYAKTGTTGDDKLATKSKLLAIVISARDLTDADFSFRNNRFYTIYFTSQNGPARQNEEFEAEVIKFVQESLAFKHYMHVQ